MAEKTEIKSDSGKEYVIPLRKSWNRVPRYKRANKAIKTIKEFLARHMKLRERDLNKIKIDRYLNEFIWFKGIRKPPARVRVKAVKEGDIVKAELSEMPEKLKFKKARLEKREIKAEEFVSGKKEKLKEIKAPEKTEEEKKEEREKAMAGEEAMKKLEKEAAKRTKHMAKEKTKQPKHLQRKALAK